MAQITIDIPDSEFSKDFTKENWEQIAKEAVEKKRKELKWKRIKKIISKSQAADKDVEELTKKAEESMMKHYSQYC